MRGAFCRLCLAHSPHLLEVFESASTAMNELELSDACVDLIKQYLSLRIYANDAYSTKICKFCYETLASFHTFYTCVEEAQIRLMNGNSAPHCAESKDNAGKTHSTIQTKLQAQQYQEGPQTPTSEEYITSELMLKQEPDELMPLDTSSTKHEELMSCCKDIKKDIANMRASIENELKAHEASIKHLLTKLLTEINFKSDVSTSEPTSNVVKESVFVTPPKPFIKIEDFRNFERTLEENEQKYLQLVFEFQHQSQTRFEKFVIFAWRSILDDEAAQHLCWKGTSQKASVRTLRTTSALRTAFRNNFPSVGDAEFDRSCISYFQFAKSRWERKRNYNLQKSVSAPVKPNKEEHVDLN